jgi:hypothetical protein
LLINITKKEILHSDENSRIFTQNLNYEIKESKELIEIIDNIRNTKHENN